jgi:deoxyadenosine/deoxycytidine kinase
MGSSFSTSSSSSSSTLTPKPFIVSLEGNIGSGKSTFVEFLKKEIQKGNDTDNGKRKIVFLQEPVDEWSKVTDKEGETILSKFYKDQVEYAFPFQMMAYISRLALLKKTVQENPGAIIITERCLITDRNVFAKMLYHENKIEEVNYKIYQKWFDTFYYDYPISKYVYLQTAPTTAYKRVKMRNRQGEIIPYSYLVTCHSYHENWLMNEKYGNVIIIDANSDETSMKKWTEKVKGILEEQN